MVGMICHRSSFTDMEMTFGSKPVALQSIAIVVRVCVSVLPLSHVK